MLDDLDSPTALRLAVASGEAVFIRAPASWEARLREAASVCGRVDDVLVVHVLGPPGLRQVVTRQTRLLIASELGIDLPRNGLMTPGKGNYSAWGIPPLTLADIRRTAPLVIACDSFGKNVGAPLRSIIDLYLEGPGSRRVVYLRARRNSEAEPTVNVIRPPRCSRKRSFPVDTAKSDWAAAVSRHRGLPPATVSGDIATLSRYGSSAVARCVEAGTVDLHEVDPGGWPMASRFLCPGLGEAATRSLLEGLCDVVTRGGGALLQLVTIPGQDGTAIPTEAKPLYAQEVLPPSGSPAIEALATFTDIDTASAALSSRWSRAVFRCALEGPEAGRNRRDFVRSFPATGDLVLDRAIAGAVDRGQRTVPLVARALGVSAALARRVTALPGLPEACIGSGRTRREEMPLSDLLVAFGHDRLPPPGDRDEGRAFLDCLDAVSGIVRQAGCGMHRVDPRDLARLAYGIPGADWKARAAALSRYTANTESAGDMVYSFGSWLGEVCRASIDSDVAFALMARHPDVMALLHASDAWHASPALTGWTAGLPADASWPVPFDTVDLGGGWSATPLGNVADLVAEGADGPDGRGLDGLSHCVATHAGACHRGVSLVISLRSNGIRNSTAEIYPNESGEWLLAGRRYALGEHSAASNADPTGEAVKALESLRSALSEGRIEVRRHALDERPPPDPVELTDEALKMLPLWRPVLPRAYRKLPPDAFPSLCKQAETRIESLRDVRG